MKEYILTFRGSNGKEVKLRKLLTPELERLTLSDYVGKKDKNGILLVSAEPVNVSVRSEIFKQFNR